MVFSYRQAVKTACNKLPPGAIAFGGGHGII